MEVGDELRVHKTVFPIDNLNFTFWESMQNPNVIRKQNPLNLLTIN